MTAPDDPVAEARKLLADVEARFGTLDYRAAEQDGAGLYSVVMAHPKPRAYALCYATTEESAALIAAAPRLLEALIERVAAAELSDAEAEFWRTLMEWTDDDYTCLEALATFISSGRCDPGTAPDMFRTLFMAALSTLSRERREALYADAFFGAFDINDNKGLPE